jgi:MFS transporter, YNFM family, putative membrane transport protein
VVDLVSLAMTTTEVRAAETGHERGSSGYRRLGLAMWCAGVAIFVLVYAPQGLLPVLATEFGVSSSTSSLALSATTGMLALAVVPLSAVAESWGRARVMTTALAVSAVLALLVPLAPTFGVLVALRALQGLALAALPALAMAHMTAEVAPRYLGGAVGLLIAGNTIGGLSGRLLAGAVADVGGWRLGLAAVGALSLACTVGFRVLLPTPLAADVPHLRLRDLRAPVLLHLRDPGLRLLFATAFLLVSVFVTVYNYLGFRLLAAPFALPSALVGLVFLGYLAGSYASSAAGRLGDRIGRRAVLVGGVAVALLGVLCTVPDQLVLVLAGLLLLTVGFFAAHSVASSWVGRRTASLRGGAPGIASAQYLFAFYVGSSVGGTAGGYFYDALGWTGVAAYVGVLLLAALGIGVALRRTPVLTPTGR